MFCAGICTICTCVTTNILICMDCLALDMYSYSYLRGHGWVAACFTSRYILGRFPFNMKVTV